jgi:penicillin amidase
VGDALGSNNWAVAASRSAGGHALLAGDPHLNLTLPSIWYEMHLVVPGTLDVAGATMAGSPGILIGFNRSLAWSVTNTGSDVLDFYREVVDDSLAPTRYRLDGEWQPLTLETAEYRDPRGALIATDTLRFSHRGPLQPNGDGWRSTRWATQEVAPDVHAWLRLNRAADVNQGLAAVADYVGPAQNFILADSTGAIAIRSTGYYPVRAGDGRGDRILDGSTRASDWTGWIAPERYPQARNPAQGFLASANQEPVDPRTSAAYLGADWPSPWRAMRINTLLRSDSAVTPEAMRRFQTDPGSVLPDLVMPHLQAAAARFNADSTRPALHQGARLLAEWDHRYTLSSRRAVLFEQVLGALGRELWDEFIPAGDSLPEIVPGQDVMVALLQEPASKFSSDSPSGSIIA